MVADREVLDNISRWMTSVHMHKRASWVLIWCTPSSLQIFFNPWIRSSTPLTQLLYLNCINFFFLEKHCKSQIASSCFISSFFPLLAAVSFIDYKFLFNLRIMSQSSQCYAVLTYVIKCIFFFHSSLSCEKDGYMATLNQTFRSSLIVMSYMSWKSTGSKILITQGAQKLS